MTRKQIPARQLDILSTDFTLLQSQKVRLH